MKINSILISAIIASSLAANSTSTIEVPVTKSVPLVKTYTKYDTKTQCTDKLFTKEVVCGQKVVNKQDNGWGQGIGTIIGGVAGSQINGNDEAKIAAGIGGALLGGFLGKRINERVEVQNEYCQETFTKQVCNQVQVPYTEEVISGYMNYAIVDGQQIQKQSLQPLQTIKVKAKVIYEW